MDDNIDDIFFDGLDSKSVEKPAGFWEDMSSNVLKESLVKPWWTTTSAYISGAVIMVATVVTVWVVTSEPNVPVENNQPVMPDTTDKIPSDSLPVSLDTIVKMDKSDDANVMSDREEESSVAREKESVETNISKKQADKDSLEDEILNEGLIQPMDSTKTVEEDVSIVDSTKLVIDIHKDSLSQKITEENKDSLIQKKKPVVVIVQDTIVVTDTVKTRKKQ
ncbi:hypothetical protein [Chondrinema litorale]|uniref:hypothetical protein n=1 Tax=Chondrinema litorale TaxID=2994555 RepID=UPI0025428890|nr:hypothetical protein [Chondrinema litorale]UZR96587.1 hypothetical protein OQ292_20785 [Chondrinema litorale]